MSSGEKVVEKPEAAISSLVKLRSYYQSQYEHYLAKATASKENRERVSLLLQDLADSEIVEKAFWEGDYEPERENFPQVREKAEIIKYSSNSLPVKEEYEDNVDAINDTRRVIEAVKASHQALEIIAEVSKSEAGKTMHLKFFQKLLEQEMSRSIDLEIVKLYLDEGIKRGYLEKDAFDLNCYRAEKETVGARSLFEHRNGGEKMELAMSEEKEERPCGFSIRQGTREEEENLSFARAYAYKLPPSPKLKATLLETVREYMISETPRRFSIRNVINYLYPIAEQQSWSRETKNKVGNCISNVLSRKAYLNKEWKRIKPGTYQPISKK